MEVRGSRNVKIHNDLIVQDITSMSDKTLKTNIRKLKYGLKEIKKINPILFDWNEDYKPKNNIGIIAQDVKEVIPEVIYQDKYTGLYSVKYDKFSMILVNALKELSQKHGKLLRKVNKQEKTIQSLVDRIEKLEEQKIN